MDVIFTSCATESNNTAIAAALRANPAKRHIETSQVEHSSVLNYCMALEKQSEDSPQSTQRSQGTAPQSASLFSVLSVVDGSSGVQQFLLVADDALEVILLPHNGVWIVPKFSNSAGDGGLET